MKLLKKLFIYVKINFREDFKNQDELGKVDKKEAGFPKLRVVYQVHIKQKLS